MADQLSRANQHEHAFFELSSLWSFLSRSDIYNCVPYSSPGFLRSDQFRHKTLRPLFLRLAPYPLILGSSRPLAGINTESSEVIQETLHLLLFPLPHAAHAPHQLSEHHAIRQSHAFHARHKPREQHHPPPAHHRVDVFTSRLHEGVQKGNREVGAVILSPTDAASKKAVVGSSKGVVKARARAPRDAASRTSALSIRILSSRGARRWYSSRVYFRKLHHVLRIYRSTSTERTDRCCCG